ncbi:spermatogenesis-associated protein 31D1-like [Octodon degus]|uniref:Spermatogenesis-associated protein 31D1-like n=1 Tax=Octodon degus TaxID=10160 RepID=A0A6P6D5Q0_OCTDE|nr:spermatogenesis-associated protein 31D1-like [Octodon degus]
MENVLSFLNSHTESWLSFGSAFLDTDPNFTFLSAAGLLFLPLCYLLLKPWLPALWRNKDIQKQHLSTKRRRTRSLRGQRTWQREADEGKKLLSVVKSPLGQQHDITHFRQLLCPDPLCKVCNSTTANISHLLSRASLEDAPHTVSRLPSIASVTKLSLTQTSAISAISAGHTISASLTEHSLPQPCTLPPYQVATSADPHSPSTQGGSVPPESNPPRFPVDQFPSEPLASASGRPHHTQEEESVLQPEAPLSLNDSSSELSIGDLSSVEASFGGHSTTYQVEPGSLRFPRSASPALIERDIKKTDDFPMYSEREKGGGSFVKQHEPDHPLTTTEKRPESVANKQHSEPPYHLWSNEGKAEELHVTHKLAGPQNLDHVEPKYSDFSHSPGLLRQSLNPLVHTAGGCFSTISNVFKAYESPIFPHTPFLSCPEVYPQSLPHILPQSQASHLHFVQAQDQLHALAQNRVTEVCFYSTQNEVQSLVLSEVHNVDCNMLQEVEESVQSLPSMVQKTQEDTSPPAHKLPLVTESSKAHVPISTHHKETAFNSEQTKKLEHHLHGKFAQHQGDLPPRVLKSPLKVCPQTQCSVTFESKGSHGINRCSLLKGQRIKDFKSFYFRSFHDRIQETVPLKKGIGKRQEHSPEIDSKDKLLGHPHRQTVLESHLERLTGKTSQALCVSLRQKQLIKALEVHLCQKFEEIYKGHTPDIVHKSRNSISPKLSLPEGSPKQIKDRHLAQLEGKGNYPNKSQNISFLSYSKQKMLEDHIKTFHNRMMWGLPHRVQKSTEIFNMKRDPSQAPFDSHFSSSDNSVSGLHPESRVYKPHKESSKAFPAHNVTTLNSVLNGPCLATTPIDKERRGPSPPSNSYKLTGNIQTVKDSTQIFLNSQHNNMEKVSQKQTLQAKRSPKLPTQLAVAGPKIREKIMSSTSDMERHQSKMVKLDYFSMCNKARGTVKAQELHVPQSQSRTILMSRKSECITGRDMNIRKPEISLATERPPGRTAVPQDGKSSGFKSQLPSEVMFEMESVDQSRAQGLPADVSLTSNDFSPKTLFYQDQSAHCENMVTLPKGQPPPENLFKNKVKCFFQWLCPSMKHRVQERSKGNTGAQSSCVHNRSQQGERAGLPGNYRDWKLSRVFARLFRQNLQGERFLPPK